MIKKLSVKNFKSLKDISLDLGPITVLVGENSTGKSSVLQLLLLLKQNLRDPKNDYLTREIGLLVDPIYTGAEEIYYVQRQIPEKSELIINLLQKLEQNSDGVLSKIAEVVITSGICTGIKLEPVDGGYSLMLETRPGQWINLWEAGSGILQIFSIVLQGFLTPKNSTLLLEQPEIYLCPRLQAELGTIIAEIARQGKTVLVETHSEHLVLRLQRLIAQGILKPGDVAIYFFKLNESGYTEAQRIGIDKLGQLENWPEGFFETDLKELDAYMDDVFERVKNEKGSKSRRGH